MGNAVSSVAGNAITDAGSGERRGLTGWPKGGLPRTVSADVDGIFDDDPMCMHTTVPVSWQAWKNGSQ